MKFTQDDLIKIYLDGAFTEEAQAEFDRLMRKDPLFAGKVTTAVAERVGPAPEDLLAKAEARLDEKVSGIWAAHRPSPHRELLKKISTLLAVTVGSGLLYFGYEHLGGRLLSPMEQAPGEISGKAIPSKTLRLASVERRAVAPSKASHKTSPEGTVARGSGPESLPSVSMPQAGSVPMGRPADRPQSPVEKGTGSTVQGHDPAVGSADAGRSSALAPVSQEGFPLRLEVETDSRQPVAVTVIDPAGLPVRNLYSGTWEAGVHSVDWDGLDDAGRPLAPGTYTVVLDAGGKVQSGTVTIHPVR
jgi:hypothetical protein